ncbi:MAG: hypothetical protein BEN19_06185 [Epulopiscium sp. Nuni2H_MBin003]|nr:MAG: hypothetical protein BEN19_06185 [Epulopiscium sp. Nuni2H_MBin003]
MDDQKKLYTDILELTKQQAKYIAEENLERVDRLIEKREALIIKLIENKHKIDKNNVEYNSIREEIIQLHNKNVEAYAKLRDQTKKELKKMRNKQHLNNAYQNAYGNTYEEGIFFDKRNH